VATLAATRAGVRGRWQQARAVGLLAGVLVASVSFFRLDALGQTALLLPVAAAAALVNEPLSGGTGDVHASPQVVADVRGEYHLAAGQLTLDLSQVDFSAANATVTATVALGQLTVIVPAGVTVDMQGHAGAGEIDLLGHVVDGLNIDAASVAAGGATETVHLNLRVGFGQVNVVRAPAVPAAPARTCGLRTCECQSRTSAPPHSWVVSKRSRRRCSAPSGVVRQCGEPDKRADLVDQPVLDA